MPDARPTLTVVMPALNEEAHIADAVAEARRAIGDRFRDWEILLFDDGSTDRTGAIMDDLARGDPHLHVVHHERPKNLGGVYKAGLALARMEYVVMIPGDNENPSDATIPALDAIGKADIVLPYPSNPEARPLGRRVISRSYVLLLNAIFGQRIRYYNGTVIHRTDKVRSIAIETDSFAYQMEGLVKLLRAGCTVVEVPIAIAPKEGRTSKAFRWKNVFGVLRAVASVASEVA